MAPVPILPLHRSSGTRGHVCRVGDIDFVRWSVHGKSEGELDSQGLRGTRDPATRLPYRCAEEANADDEGQSHLPNEARKRQRPYASCAEVAGEARGPAWRVQASQIS